MNHGKRSWSEKGLALTLHHRFTCKPSSSSALLIRFFVCNTAYIVVARPLPPLKFSALYAPSQFSPHLLPNFDPIISTVKFNLNFGSPSLERVAALRLFAINISLNITCQTTANKATPQSRLLGNHGETATLEHQLMEVEPPTLHRF